MKRCFHGFKLLFALTLLVGLLACQTATPDQPAASATPADPAAIGLAPGSTGNPPLIPHEVDAADTGEVCIGCHKTGEMGAPKYPDWHATLVDCRQCHVPAEGTAQPFAPKY